MAASGHSAHLYVIDMAGKGKSNPLEWCLYQDIATGRGCGLIDPNSLLVGGLLSKSSGVQLLSEASSICLRSMTRRVFSLDLQKGKQRP